MESVNSLRIWAPQWWPLCEGRDGKCEGRNKKWRIFGKGKCKLIAACEFLARESVNSSPTLARQWWRHFRLSLSLSLSLLCISLSLSLSLSLPLSPKESHTQYRKRFRASYNESHFSLPPNSIHRMTGLGGVCVNRGWWFFFNPLPPSVSHNVFTQAPSTPMSRSDQACSVQKLNKVDAQLSDRTEFSVTIGKTCTTHLCTRSPYSSSCECHVCHDSYIYDKPMTHLTVCWVVNTESEPGRGRGARLTSLLLWCIVCVVDILYLKVFFVVAHFFWILCKQECLTD